MKLKSIRICNFRSIEDGTFEITKKAGGYTYTLIGLNESGKSNFLRAVSLHDDGIPTFPTDYYNPTKPIEVIFTYELDAADRKELRQTLETKEIDKNILPKISVSEVKISSIFEPSLPVARRRLEEQTFERKALTDFTVKDGKVEKKSEPSDLDLDLQGLFSDLIPEYFWQHSHYVSIWKADSSHLINAPIDLSAFAANQEISVPLANCFSLAGLEDISAAIASLADNPAAIKNLQDRLEDKVTEHIKRVWPDHPVRIKFQINNNSISFLIEDEEVKYEAKTIDQRSDGFRQFVSFLLTISAESVSGQLANTLLLLDEPETFLHPQAQEYLKGELIRLTSGKENNLVFFATHSNYMIDKDNLDRCYRVSKKGNKTSEWEMIPGHGVSYAQVNYEVFGIPSTDYHNELYGYLEDVKPVELASLKTDMNWENTKTSKAESVSLSKYIRHSIHHPENTKNKKFSPSDLVKSIEILRSLKAKK